MENFIKDNYRGIVFYFKIQTLVKRNWIDKEFILNFFSHCEHPKRADRHQKPLWFRNYLAKVFKNYRHK